MPYPKRSKRQSILRCKKLWETVRNNPGIFKYEAYEILGWSPYSDRASCPACSYRKTHKKHYCRGACILPWTGGLGCLERIDEYSIWRADPTPENADAIVKVCNRALKNL